VIAHIVYKALSEESSNESPPEYVASQTRYDAVGIDSLSIVSAVILIEDRMGIQIQGKEISQATTIPMLVDLVQQKVKSA